MTYKLKKSNKERRCFICTEKINVGEHYYNNGSTGSHAFSTGALCVPCFEEWDNSDLMLGEISRASNPE